MSLSAKPPTASLRAKEGLMGKGPGLAIYAASFAVVGFIGGALVGPHPDPHDEFRAPRVAGQPGPIRQVADDAVSQEAEPQRVDPLGAEPPPVEAGVAARDYRAGGFSAEPSCYSLGTRDRAVSKGGHDWRRSCEKRITRPAGPRTQRMGCGALRICWLRPYRGLYARASRLASDGRAAPARRSGIARGS